MNWEQFRAILWLRWRLTRNRLVRAGPLNVIISVLVSAFMVVGAVGAGVAGVLVGAFALKGEQPQVLMLIWDGALLAFLFVWFTGLMVEIQRSESIDLPKLLHLPVTLQQVFVLNYLASHLAPSIVLFVPAVMGFCAGLVVSGGIRMVLLAPLVLGFIWMVTAWTYCLRGWLTALMVNKRRRRAVILWITIGFVLVAQLPNVFVHSRWFRGATRPHPKAAGSQSGDSAGQQQENLVLAEPLVEAHLAIPLGWVGYGAMALKQGNPWPAIGCTAAGWLIGALGLMRAYRATIRFYQGAEGGAESRPAPQAAAPARGSILLVERRLPWLRDDTAALALATFRSLLRAPEMKIALIMPVCLAGGLASIHFTRARTAPPGYLTAFAATGVAVFAAFSSLNVMSNAFGLDRNGFRTLVLLPTPRHRILFAKNLAIFPFVCAVALVLLAVVKLLMRMPWSVVAAGLVQVPMAFMLFCVMCNLSAILVPYRMASGSLQTKKVKPVVMLAVLATMVLMPLIMLPVFVAPCVQMLFSFLDWMPGLPVNLLVSLPLLPVVAGLYWLLLPLEGRLLQKREQIILREVTEEAE